MDFDIDCSISSKKGSKFKEFYAYVLC